MIKPNNYDSTRTGGDYTPVELGGHIAVIKRVVEGQSKKGKPMLTIGIDFDINDVQPGYFKKAFDEDNRPVSEKKWPYAGMKYVMCEDMDGNCSRDFKSFITSVERSNNSTCVWGNGFESWFVGKKVGVVYGEEESEYNGKTSMRRTIRYFCQADKAKSAPVPKSKYINGSNMNTTASNTTTNAVFTPTAVDDEDIPF